MSIGENIRELRQRAGLTQAQFAQKLGVTKETVCRWERDATTIRKRHVDQLVRIFDIVPDDILSSSGSLASRRDLPLPSNNLHDNPPPSDAERAGEHHPHLPAQSFPVYKIVPAPSGTSIVARGHAYAPPDIAARHPHAAFFPAPAGELNRVFPSGSLLLVDPNLRPWNGCCVVAALDARTVLVRRFAQAKGIAALSCHSFTVQTPEIVVDQRRVRILGVVVWFQAGHDMGEA